MFTSKRLITNKQMRMHQPFQLAVVETEQGKNIDFANQTSDFVEVLFSIDGKEVKRGELFDFQTRGYCYPPEHHKPIRMMKSGQELPFKAHGMVKAYVFAGQGEYKNEDYEVPAFIRKKLRNRVVSFSRASHQPIAVLEVPY